MPILTVQERLGTQIVGRYRIDRLLASGGMSVLFAARDLRAHRTVALKLLRAEDCVEERRKARFLQEMRLTAKLRHPNVVDVLDLGEDESGAPYLVMELLHGRSLQAELDEHGTLSFEQALAIVLPVMEALAAVHAAGVVHRDVKPDNIFLHVDPRGTVTPKLLDFGIAKSADTTLATRTGAVLGTPDYMAPEQVVAGSVGPSADIWAIGAVLYRTLRGHVPYHAETSAEVIAKLTRDSVPQLSVPGLPATVCAAIDRALAREADDRYGDMSAFAQALVVCAREAGLAVAHSPVAERLANDSAVALQRTITAPSLSAEPRPRGRYTPWLAAVAALFGLALLLARWSGAREQPVAHASAATEAAPQLAQSAPSPAVDPKPIAAPSSAVTAPAAAQLATSDAMKPIDAVPVRKPSATRPRGPRPAAHAAHAAAVHTRFARQADAGALPVAVEW